MSNDDFPVPQDRESTLIYFDHHASTPLLPEVQAAITSWLTAGYGNPSNSLHPMGEEACQGIDWARRHIAGLINAESDEILFTSGATESNNLALRGSLHSGNSLVISNFEHESVSQTAAYLESNGLEVHEVPGNEFGMVTPGNLEHLLQNHSADLVSVIAGQGEIGTINPVKALAEVAHQYGAKFHTDAAQAVGKIPVDVRDWDVDYLTIAAHKMYGPKGIGVLFKKTGAPLSPILYGAGHEHGYRPGTENVPYIIGFGEAARIAQFGLVEEADRQQHMRDYLWETLRQNISGIRLNGHPTRRHPGNLHVSLPNINSLNLLKLLPNYALSVGSACHSDHPMDNPLIQALNIPERYAQGAVRIGLGRQNTMEQVEQFSNDFVKAFQEIAL